MKIILITILFGPVLVLSAFGGSEDRFFKKYAMMKIYESCFGPEVVKQIRKEMKAACAKCAVLEPPSQPRPPVAVPQEPVLSQPDNTLYSSIPQQQPTFDAEKLQQAILAFRPQQSPASIPQSAFYRPYSNPFYSQQFANPAYSNSMYYPGYPQHPSQYNPYAFPLLGQSFYSNRVSRDMDMKTQIEALTSRISGKVRNVTCVMQELGYLDENLEPDFERITEKIATLPVQEELRKDMQDGVAFCQEFSQCVPKVTKYKSPLSRELIRPMFFFKCYKHKKLEACIMKDVREKYSGVTDEELDDSDVEFRRTGKSLDIQKGAADNEIEQLSSSMYEFLYASDSNLDLDTLL